MPIPLNSQSLNIPFQPACNPSDADRYRLAAYALQQRRRLEDLPFIARLMSPPPDILTILEPGSLRDKQVAVMGAGLAGLAAAFELRKLGCDITLFEALENRVGGRVYTWYFDRAKTLYGEFGPMRIPVTHEAVWHYIKLLKLPTRTFIQSNPNALIHLRGVGVPNDYRGVNVMRLVYPRYRLSSAERNTPWQELGYYGIESHILKASPETRSEMIRVKPAYRPETLFWDAASNRQMLEYSGITQDAINLLGSLFPLMGQNLYNSYIDYIQEAYPANLSYLYRIDGGFVRMPEAFMKALLSNSSGEAYKGIEPEKLGKVRFKAGCPIDGIHPDADGEKVRLHYSCKSEGCGNAESFDYVLCAIPFSTLRTVDIQPAFSPLKMQAIKEVNYIDAQKTLMLFRRKFWEAERPGGMIPGGGSYTDLPITTLWYPGDTGYPAGQEGASRLGSLNPNKPGVLMSYGFSLDSIRLASMRERKRLNTILQQTEQVHGLPEGTLDPLIEDFKTVRWNDEPWFRGALCYFTPGQKRLFSWPMALPEYGGRVFFAGDHISAVHRWMQGALQSGMEAANALAQTCRERMQ